MAANIVTGKATVDEIISAAIKIMPDDVCVLLLMQRINDSTLLCIADNRLYKTAFLRSVSLNNVIQRKIICF
jgi:hypothetical protein